METALFVLTPQKDRHLLKKIFLANAVYKDKCLMYIYMRTAAALACCRFFLLLNITASFREPLLQNFKLSFKTHPGILRIANKDSTRFILSNTCSTYFSASLILN